MPELLELDSAKRFLKPVNANDEKHRVYHKMIRDPMDLTSIHNRLKNNFYKTAQNCTDDFLLLFQNASQFYSKGDPEFKAASSLKQIWKTSIKKLPSGREKFENKIQTHAVHEGQNKNDHKCEICNKFFQNEEDLKTHVYTFHESLENYNNIIAVHQNQKDDKCELCLKSLKSSEDVENHICIVHEDQIDQKCDICSKSFSKDHECIVHKCEMCTGVFINENEMKQHFKAVHEGSKDHKCESSGKSLTIEEPSSSNKKRQRDSSTGSEKSAKISKVETNSNICTTCNKQFGRSHELQRHINSVHKENSIECPHCDEKFARKDTLKRHITRKHETKK